MASARVVLVATFALVACAEDDSDPCREASGLLQGVFGEFLSVSCDEGEPTPCPSQNTVYVFSSDPNGDPDAEEVARQDNVSSFAIELPEGSYVVCRFLGDTAFDCIDDIVIDAVNPIQRFVYTWDGADSAWGSEGC